MAGETATSPAKGDTLRVLLRSLRSRNYRLFFYGQFISLVGTWLTSVAMAWMVYNRTNDTLQSGIVGFVGQIPAFFLAPLGGVLVDRWNPHRVLVATQVLSMLQSVALAALTLTHVITVPMIWWLCAFQGLINAFDMPARQAIIVRLVEKREDLSNAIALNSSMFNAARLLGPAIASVLIWLFGEGGCFLIDAFSYLAVIAALLMMRLPPIGKRPPARHPLVELKEGVVYSLGFPPIRSILLMVAAMSLMGVPFSVLIPAYVKKELHSDARLLGLLMACSGLGALAGAIHLAMRKSIVGLGRVIPKAAAGFGCCLIGLGLSHWVWLSAPLMAVAGFCMISQMASSNTMLQTIVDDDKRGRVMSLFGMSFQGMMPIGSLMAGYLAQPERLGTPRTVMLGGVCCILVALLFSTQLPMLKRLVHPIYIKRGILPEVARGIGASAEVAQVRQT